MNSAIDGIRDNRWIEISLRWLVGLIFVYVSAHKIAYPARFAEIVCNYQLFPDFIVHPIAVIVPFFELVCGAALVLGIFPRSAAMLIMVMLLIFIAVLSVNLVRDVAFDCGCISFGETEKNAVPALIVRDFIMFVMCGHVLFFRKKRKWCVRQTGTLLDNR